MFIDRIPNRRSPPAILLRESFRQDGKSRKRTLANLSKLPKHVVDALDALLKGTTQTPSSGAFDIVRSLPHGHAAAVLGSLRNCGIDRIVAPRRSPQRDLVAGMIAARILEPSSKLAMVRRFAPETATSTLADELGLPAEEIDENLLYEAMDWLVERQEAIERRLAGKHLEEGALVLYDMTSAWSYSRCCPLVRHGYSRDGKKGVPQIEFGLLCDRAGWPVAIEAFKGNTADPSTVAAQIGKLRRRFKWVVLVGDRGMLLVSAKTSSLRGSIGSAPCARPGSVLWSPTARCNPPFSTSWPRSRAKNFTPESGSWSAATPCWRKSGRVSAKIC